jgi:hypothetical protein
VVSILFSLEPINQEKRASRYDEENGIGKSCAATVATLEDSLHHEMVEKKWRECELG